MNLSLAFGFFLAAQAFAATDALKVVRDTQNSGLPNITAARAITAAPNGLLYAAVGNCESGCVFSLVGYNEVLVPISSLTLTNTVWEIATDTNSTLFVASFGGFYNVPPPLTSYSSTTVGTGSENFFCLALSSQTGQVVLAGQHTTSGLPIGLFKYSTNLTFISSRTVVVAPNNGSTIRSVSISPDGSIFVVGDSDIGFSKFDNNLNFISSRTLPGIGQDILILPTGEIVVTGTPTWPGQSFIEKYDFNLNRLNSALFLVGYFFGSGNLAADSSGNLYVAMHGVFENGNQSTAVMKWSPSLSLMAQGKALNAARVFGATYHEPSGQFVVSGRNGSFTSMWIGAFGSAPTETVDNAYGYPSPYSRSLASQMTFVNLPGKARIRIFNVAGQFVRELTASQSGAALWDVRDISGNGIPPGTYVVHAFSEGSTHRFTVMVLP